VASFGVLYHIEFAFALIGLIMLFARRYGERWLLLAWLLLFPAGAMLTSPSQMPHALRTIVALPLPQILAAVGVVELLRSLRERAAAGRLSRAFAPVVAAITVLAAGASVAAFSTDLFRYYPTYSMQAWESGFGEALQAAREEAQDAPLAISGSIALAPYLVIYYDATPPEELMQRGFDALNAMVLPPTNFRFDSIWPFLPRDTVLLTVPQDDLRGLAYPTHIIHPPAPTQAEREQMPPLYVIYRKVQE